MLKNFMTISSFTLLSRVLGLVRDVLFFRVLGTTIFSDAFVVAFRFPNMFRRIFGEGAFNAAFVPQFAGALEEEGEAKAADFVSNSFSWMVVVLGIGTVIAIPLMPWIMALFAPGYLSEGDQMPALVQLPAFISGSQVTEKFAVTVSYARIMFSYLLCMSLVAQLSGVMNTLRRFGIPAFSPVLLNICAVSALSLAVFALTDRFQAGLWLCWAICISGLLQLLLLFWGVRRCGIAVRLVVPRRSERIDKLFVRMGPGVMSAGVQQINLAIGTMIASMQHLAPTYLYGAERIYQFPLGMIGVGFAIVLLPEISRSLRGKRIAEAQSTLRDGLVFSMLLTVPASVAMLVIPAEITNILFGWGEATNVGGIAKALVGFAFGIPAYVLIKVLQPAYFAQEDTKTPMFMAGVTVLTNVILSLVLFPFIGYLGIALATSVSGWVNVFLLARGLRGFMQIGQRSWGRLGKIVLASGIMGVLVALAALGMHDWLYGGALQRLGSFVLLAGFGLVSYAFTTLKLGATSVAEIKQSLGRKADG